MLNFFRRFLPVLCIRTSLLHDYMRGDDNNFEGKHCNEPLPGVGSFISSTALLAHSSLNGEGPVSIAIKQQSVSIVFIGNCEHGPSKMRYSKLLRPHNNERAHVHPYYCTELLIFKSKSAYGGFTFLSLRCLEE
ncbi:hypothetical protein T03_10461 [Trichinella britovi]|uniref:Uncharacterized protein n=1 Tax=Trichinella britovi TaxID=45882 RepID=A0A0V1CG52_TRIBR|nr:hypothetical protein T03_10461 [Trichinella britovi]